MNAVKIDKAFKKLSKTCSKASKDIKLKIEKQNEAKKKNQIKKFLDVYKDEIPLVRASLKRISIEQAAKEIQQSHLKGETK